MLLLASACLPASEAGAAKIQVFIADTRGIGGRQVDGHPRRRLLSRPLCGTYVSGTRDLQRPWCHTISRGRSPTPLGTVFHPRTSLSQSLPSVRSVESLGEDSAL